MDDRPTYALVDLDGVVADVRHRLGFLERRPKDWDAFFSAAVDDLLLPEGAAVVRELVERGHAIVWLTGRPERCRRDTVQWLRTHGLPSQDLRMRRDGDRRPARTTKLETARALAAHADVAVVVDDDDHVVAAMRAAGFAVLHTRWMGDDAQTTLYDAQESDGRT